MKLRVIIPSYNAPETIATQVETVGSQQGSEPWEIIASGEGSTDESLGMVGRHFDLVGSRIDTEKPRPPWVERGLGAHPQEKNL